MGRSDHSPRFTTVLRGTVLASLLLVLAPAIFVSAYAAGASVITSMVLAGLGCVFGTAISMRWLPLELGAGAWPRFLLICMVALTAVAGYRIANLSVYMLDISAVDYAYDPELRPHEDEMLGRPFYPKHNCFTCYVVAGHLASEGVDDIYDRQYYRRATVRTPIHDQIGDGLHVDTFQYPPTFLVLPGLLQLTGGDFYQLRAYWYGFNTVLLSATMLGLILWIGGHSFHPLWLLLPAMFTASNMIATLQMQNVHLFMLTITMLSLWAFVRGWHGLGGAMLAFAIACKIYPGALLLFLVFQRRWRSAIWTCVWGLAYLGGTIVVFGFAPYIAFYENQLPRLASGEAFQFAFEYVAPAVKNTSIAGVMYKLQRLGVMDDPALLLKVVMWIHNVMLLAFVVWMGRKKFDWTPHHTEPTEELRAIHRKLAQVWVVILIFGQLRSPFLPWMYGNVAMQWLLALLIPISVASLGRLPKLLLVALAWMVFTASIPLSIGPPAVKVDLIYTLIASGFMLVCCALVLVKDRRSERTTIQPSTSVG